MKTKKTRKQITKELFNMVYNWGSLGIDVDENAPAYKETIEELINAERPDVKLTIIK